LATAGYIATRSANIFFSERARAREQIFLYTIQQISGPVIGLGLGLIMLNAFGPDPLWPLTGFCIAQMIAVIGALVMSDFGRDFGRPDKRMLRDALNYGLPLVGSNFATWITLNSARFIVERLLGVAAAGLFAVGFGLGQRAGAVSAMLVTAAAFPLAVKRLEQEDEAGALRQLSSNAALLFAVLLPTCAGLAALRYDVVTTLVGLPFRDAAYTILPISVSLGAIRNLRAHSIDQIFLLHHRTGLILKLTFLEAICAVVFSGTGAFIWGIPGAAIGVLCATIIGFAASAALSIQRYKLILPSTDLIKITLATLIMAGLLLLLPPALNWEELLVKILYGAGVNMIALAGFYFQAIRRQFLTACS
jgi:O-antigen/teichoic acid export membrane protein